MSHLLTAEQARKLSRREFDDSDLKMILEEIKERALMGSRELRIFNGFGFTKRFNYTEQQEETIKRLEKLGYMVTGPECPGFMESHPITIRW